MNPDEEPSSTPAEILAGVRAFTESRPFTPFQIETVSGAIFPVPTAEHLALPPAGHTIVVFADNGQISAVLHAGQISHLGHVPPSPRKRKKAA